MRGNDASTIIGFGVMGALESLTCIDHPDNSEVAFYGHPQDLAQSLVHMEIYDIWRSDEWVKTYNRG